MAGILSNFCSKLSIQEGEDDQRQEDDNKVVIGKDLIEEAWKLKLEMEGADSSKMYSLVLWGRQPARAIDNEGISCEIISKLTAKSVGIQSVLRGDAEVTSQRGNMEFPTTVEADFQEANETNVVDLVGVGSTLPQATEGVNERDLRRGITETSDFMVLNMGEDFEESVGAT
ncbi:pyruvate dehydrogenase E1 (beta subunit) [Corchorus olitorius]|uniref:Pyruvate dehydrogenase E1 (Beta subunit) n=1 Tax=Corchorus olitorius TaxID=93759 RepID=A0A1R3G8E6_9ROSI|nr:pyruvate dehydrogenase E1 (beta subunit) [Corchorus olitorius]